LDAEEVYEILLNRYGDMKWWPANNADEVIIGAILTQNTSWKNVEKSLAVLSETGMLSLREISESDERKIKEAIRSSGFYNRKAVTLKVLASEILKRYGSIEIMKAAPTSEVRDFLFSITGIGEETRDDILLYALDIPVFIIDGYTRRIITRIFKLREPAGKSRFAWETANSLGKDAGKLKNFHAMLVQLGKDHCRPKPVCSGCPMKNICLYSKNNEL
jgi:endonuclease-3 related protein